MALKIKTPKLQIEYLVLVGNRKNYKVKFDAGLNIIYGDSDTGKSSILNLINYSLGSSSVDLYEEIEVTGRFCLLQVLLNGQVYTIKRNIFKYKAEIEVYRCEYDKIDDFFPKFYSPSYAQKSEDGFFSEFLLSSMNIPLVKVKEAPSKADSKMINLSFRDIFKYNYLDQDKIGSKKLFGENYAYLTKLKEAYKLMFDVLDKQILEVTNLITDTTSKKNDLAKKNESVSNFLKSTEVSSLKDLIEKKETLESEISLILGELKNIDSEILRDTFELNYLRTSIEEKEIQLSDFAQILNNNNQEIKQNIALRNEYSNDIRKILSTIEILEKFPKIEDRTTNCPVCEQTMNISKLKEHFVNSDSGSIKGELNGLRRRKKDLDHIHNVLKEQIEKNENKYKSISSELEEMRNFFNIQSKNIVSPFISKRDAMSQRLGNLESDIKNLNHFYKIRIQQSINLAEIEDLEQQIKSFKENLDRLSENAPSLENIFKNLSKNLKEFLDFIGVKNTTNTSISPKTFLPVIRNKDYEQITSGGVRTLSSVGYFISLMTYAMENPVNYPSFLMVDTIAKYIGKTKIKDKDLEMTDLAEDIKEGMNDSQKYENIYKYLIELNKFATSFQMIIVDNDIPESMAKKLQPFVRKHFSVDPTMVDEEIGFIDDAIMVNQLNNDIQLLKGDDIIEGDIFFDEDDVE